MIALTAWALYWAAGAAAAVAEGASSRSLTSTAEIGQSMFVSKTIPCDPSVVGSEAACFSASIPATNNQDYLFSDPIISHGNGVKPWGVHLTGPYPDGVSYLLSFHVGNSTVGPFSNLIQHDTTKWSAVARLSMRTGRSSSLPMLSIDIQRNNIVY